jgi:hypothetical protein
MKRMTLFEANAFLHEASSYRDYLIRTVASSTAVETGESVKTIARRLQKFLDAGSPPFKPRRRRRSS